MLAAGVVNVGLGLVLATGWPVSGWPVVEIVVGLRMLTAGWDMRWRLAARPRLPSSAME